MRKAFKAFSVPYNSDETKSLSAKGQLVDVIPMAPVDYYSFAFVNNVERNWEYLGEKYIQDDMSVACVPPGGQFHTSQVNGRGHVNYLLISKEFFDYYNQFLNYLNHDLKWVAQTNDPDLYFLIERIFREVQEGSPTLLIETYFCEFIELLSGQIVAKHGG